MKRGGIKPSGGLQRSGGLKQRSAKTLAKYAGAAGVEGRRAFVARLLRERPLCQAGARISAHSKRDQGCGGHAPSCDVHEILARSAGGSILDEANCLCLCRRCHDWVGAHPIASIALGLRLSRYPGRNPSHAETP